jgi:hypothetical protein
MISSVKILSAKQQLNGTSKQNQAKNTLQPQNCLKIHAVKKTRNKRRLPYEPMKSSGASSPSAAAWPAPELATRDVRKMGCCTGI